VSNISSVFHTLQKCNFCVSPPTFSAARNESRLSGMPMSALRLMRPLPDSLIGVIAILCGGAFICTPKGAELKGEHDGCRANRHWIESGEPCHISSSFAGRPFNGKSTMTKHSQIAFEIIPPPLVPAAFSPRMPPTEDSSNSLIACAKRPPIRPACLHALAHNIPTSASPGDAAITWAQSGDTFHAEGPYSATMSRCAGTLAVHCNSFSIRWHNAAAASGSP